MSQRCGYRGCGHLVLAEGACGERRCPLHRASASPRPPPGRSSADLDATGVIHQITAGRRNRVRAVEEVFDLLDRFELDIAEDGDGRRRAPTRHLRHR